MHKKLSDIASFLGGFVIGDGDVEIRAVSGIEEASEGDLTFVANPRYRADIATTGASAILVPRDITAAPKPLVVVDDPYVSLARVLTLLYPDEAPPAGISEGAFIAPDASIAENVTICPGSCVGSSARLDRGVTLYPGVVVGDGAVIGEDSVLYPNVTIYRRCIIGKRVVLHAGVVVGSDGFGFAGPGTGNVKVPQVGIVRIDDDCEIGANTTIDRGTLGVTWIKEGVKIDNLVQIAHNVVIGERSVVVAQVGISGSTRIGRGVLLGGQAGLVGHITVGDGAMVAAKTGIHKNVPPGTVMSGFSQMPHRLWLRTQATLPQLPEMRKRLLDLAARIEQIEQVLQSMNDNEAGTQ
ncbi:MAG: UDP-3-O-(3-hydroxymyristoyl)glucosamine N-acyltransferase [Syntrophales bacterium]|jgi:UDP-3-O-[3-hydroxymyristoyl] glucosamine N-acyltransferase|nr:UDP-3-O-(3-hydroxymyristoyl)glucosamine N-acyltransferase [Syntrophales bacterium]MCK9527719.1 UDP-3-O-(3-hydroxymyristoyl)glucosamine N-acyltransferase [Syntrophales bacterium]MDX9921626.1 UDP-3-O-(3-hydroxymyristoyl)glucosamine N-acyltransferase [Syntrophales bacterium]